MSRSSVIPALQRELVSPKDTQEGEEYLRSNSHQIAVTPLDEPKGAQDGKNTGYWLQIAEMHMRGMISFKPTLASSRTQKSTQFHNLRYLASFN